MTKCGREKKKEEAEQTNACRSKHSLQKTTSGLKRHLDTFGRNKAKAYGLHFLYKEIWGGTSWGPRCNNKYRHLTRLGRRRQNTSVFTWQSDWSPAHWGAIHLVVTRHTLAERPCRDTNVSLGSIEPPHPPPDLASPPRSPPLLPKPSLQGAMLPPLPANNAVRPLRYCVAVQSYCVITCGQEVGTFCFPSSHSKFFFFFNWTMTFLLTCNHLSGLIGLNVRSLIFVCLFLFFFFSFFWPFHSQY